MCTYRDEPLVIHRGTARELVTEITPLTPRQNSPCKRLTFIELAATNCSSRSHIAISQRVPQLLPVHRGRDAYIPSPLLAARARRFRRRPIIFDGERKRNERQTSRYLNDTSGLIRTLTKSNVFNYAFLVYSFCKTIADNLKV